MVYHYYQRLPSAGIILGYKMAIPDKVIGVFSWFVSDIIGRAGNKNDINN